jgi:hypothetical protein
MITSHESQRAIDNYLAALRRELRDLMEEDMNDIVSEIRAHIVDKNTAGTDIEQTLAGLGAPRELAARYCTEDMMRRAEAHRSSVQKARLAVRWTFVIAATLALVAISAAGYFVGGGLIIFGVAKVMWPHGTGLWETQGPGDQWGLGLSGGSGNAPPANAHDILGWWLLPLGFVVGPALIYFTYRLGRWSVRKLFPRRKSQFALSEAQTEV